MSQAQIQEKINNFLNILSKSSALPERKREHGLIVIEDMDKSLEISAEEIVNKINDAVFCADAGKYHLFVNSLKRAVENKSNLVVNVKEKIHSKIISILKESFSGSSVYLENFKNQEVFCLELNSNLRIIFIGKRSVLENKVQYKYLYNLFGPILSI